MTTVNEGNGTTGEQAAGPQTGAAAPVESPLTDATAPAQAPEAGPDAAAAPEPAAAAAAPAAEAATAPEVEPLQPVSAQKIEDLVQSLDARYQVFEGLAFANPGVAGFVSGLQNQYLADVEGTIRGKLDQVGKQYEAITGKLRAGVAVDPMNDQLFDLGSRFDAAVSASSGALVINPEQDRLDALEPLRTARDEASQKVLSAEQAVNEAATAEKIDFEKLGEARKALAEATEQREAAEQSLTQAGAYTPDERARAGYDIAIERLRQLYTVGESQRNEGLTIGAIGAVLGGLQKSEAAGLAIPEVVLLKLAGESLPELKDRFDASAKIAIYDQIMQVAQLAKDTPGTSLEEDMIKLAKLAADLKAMP